MQPLAEVAGAAPLDVAPGVLQRLLEAVAAERLQQVVEGVDLEGLEGVLVVGGHEDHRRHLLGADLLDHAEAVAGRHLHVEEHQIGLLVLDRVDRLLAVGALADQLDVLFLLQQADDALARHRLVVHDHRPDLGHATPSIASVSRASISVASVATSSIGIAITTDNPPPAGRRTSKRCWSP